MNKNKEENSVIEHYWDAAAAAFMECYSREQKSKTDNVEPAAISEALHLRAIRTIRRGKRQYYLKKTAHALKKIGAYAAAFLLVLLIAGGGLQSVKARQSRLQEVKASPFFQKVEYEWLISSSLIPNYRYEEELVVLDINKEDPLEGMLPDGYVLPEENLETYEYHDYFSAFYEHPNGGLVSISSFDLSGNTWISAYKTAYMAHISVYGFPGLLVVRENGVEIVLVSEKSQQVFVLFASDLSKTETEEIAEKFAKQIAH